MSSSSRAIKQALRDYCNLTTDLAELGSVSKTQCAEDKVLLNECKRQLHEHMQAHHIDCLFDEASGKFLYRAFRSSARPLSEDMQALIIEEIAQAEQEGKLKFVDLESLVLDVVRLIQQVRTGKTESLKISDKKPTSVAAAVTPSVQELAKLLSTYLSLDEKLKKLDASMKEVKKELTEKLTEVKPLVEEYCKSRSIVKKPMDFQRRMSSSFSGCIVKFEPGYFNRVKQARARRFLQYKQSKYRNRKVTTLRPSKKHMAEVLEGLTTKKTSGWTHTSLVQTLFKTLYEEAEEVLVKKLEENENTPVFKVSLTGKDEEEE